MEKRLESKMVYKGKILNLRVDKVLIEENGNESIREVVEHDPSVAVLPVLPNGNIVLIKQYRYALEREFIEVPAGVFREGELPEEAAKRELKEETGFITDKLVKLGMFYPSCGFLTEVLHIYVAHVKDRGETDMDEDEVINTFEVSIEEALMMIKNGYIQDMKSVIAILMYNQG